MIFGEVMKLAAESEREIEKTKLTFFKFATIIVESGLWAKMSATAKSLYPVLLRFSDQHFKPVYPGTKHLLVLTGFKSKASLKRARKELISLGLISVQSGYGRKNTRYYFHFDSIIEGYTLTPQRGESKHLTRAGKDPSEGKTYSPGESREELLEGSQKSPPYNKINISINNQVPNQEKNIFREMREQYGDEKVDLAISECQLAGIKVNFQSLLKILKQKQGLKSSVCDSRDTWESLVRYLQGKISPTSLELIKQAKIDDKNGVFVFRSALPLHLKSLLEKICGQVIFEPDIERPSQLLTRKIKKENLN